MRNIDITARNPGIVALIAHSNPVRCVTELVRTYMTPLFR
jgi:hypothetical protein